jgi:AAA+ ATPase superfamily predicted ATPase
MSPDPSPFTAVANRMVRPIDQELASVLASEKAIVRLLGPRRIGKTELVSQYAA